MGWACMSGAFLRRAWVPAFMLMVCLAGTAAFAATPGAPDSAIITMSYQNAADLPGLPGVVAAALGVLVLAALVSACDIRGRARAARVGSLVAGVGGTAVVATFAGGWAISSLVPPLWPGPRDAAGFAAQALFALAAFSVPASLLAGRARLWPLLVFGLVFCGILQPVLAGGLRGSGIDGGGAVSVWLAGGLAALAGVLVLGARGGVSSDGLWGGFLPPVAAAAITIAAAGMGDAAVAGVLLAAAGGALAVLLSAVFSRRGPQAGSPSPAAGALAGLLALSAAPAVPDLIIAPAAGVAGAILCRGAGDLLRRLGIGTAGGALAPVLAGSVLAPAIAVLWRGAAPAAALPQLTAAAAFVFIASLVLWLVLDLWLDLRDDSGPL